MGGRRHAVPGVRARRGPKVGKNRVHLDLVSASDAEQRATVQRLEGLGARRIDVGQGDVPWVVMADPEGNEFCVLRPPSSPVGGTTPASD